VVQCWGTVLAATGVCVVVQCWGTVLVATGVCVVAPEAKANALRPHEPSVCLSISVFRVLPCIDSDCYVRNVGHCVPQSLSL